MATELKSAPILSTPAEYTFIEDPTAAADLQAQRPRASDNDLFRVYEIGRTAVEIAQKGWRRVALQFPDAMLRDAGWVVGALGKELAKLPISVKSGNQASVISSGSAIMETDMNAKTPPRSEPQPDSPQTASITGESTQILPRFYVLADTSYSSCCVDEIAAEHADADAVVHYGRACLSPTSRLPVLHVFTKQELDYNNVLESFEKEFGEEKGKKVVIMADVMFQEHVQSICDRLLEKGWTGVRATQIVRDPSAAIPNRKIILPDSSETKPEAIPEISETDLKDYHLFHISIPPTALLLTLSSRLSSLRILTTPASPYTTAETDAPDPSITPKLLGRRYGLVLKLATASIIGILINTLSVSNYLPTITRLRNMIAAADKKSYTIVVGKLNAAKLANFAEVDGWVVVGCWESGLVEQDGMWKPVVTPFELELALAGDDKRIWDGTWWGGIEGVGQDGKEDAEEKANKETVDSNYIDLAYDIEGGVSDEESAPPEFDLRTGKLVSNSRPMRLAIRNQQVATNGRATTDSSSTEADKGPSNAVAQRKMGELAMVNGVLSPGAQYLRSQRTWQGLGTDFKDADDDEKEYEESTIVEEGRSGVARGYTVGEDEGKS